MIEVPGSNRRAVARSATRRTCRRERSWKSGTCSSTPTHSLPIRAVCPSRARSAAVETTAEPMPGLVTAQPYGLAASSHKAGRTSAQERADLRRGADRLAADLGQALARDAMLRSPDADDRDGAVA